MTTTAREVIADSGRTIASGDDMTTYADKLEDADAIIVALDAAGFVIVSKEALNAGSDGYG